MMSSTEPFPLYYVKLNHQHIQSTKSRTLSIHGPSTSATEPQLSSFAMPRSEMFNNLHGCTINITWAPPPTQPLLMPNIEKLTNYSVMSPYKLGACIHAYSCTLIMSCCSNHVHSMLYSSPHDFPWETKLICSHNFPCSLEGTIYGLCMKYSRWVMWLVIPCEGDWHLMKTAAEVFKHVIADGGFKIFASKYVAIKGTLTNGRTCTECYEALSYFLFRQVMKEFS